MNAELIERREKIVKERFFEKIEKTDSCWIWKSYMSRSGSPLYKITFLQWFAVPSYIQRFSGGKDNYSAELLSWVLSGREIPANHFLRQTCKNNRCVNPEHFDLLERNLINCPD